MPCGDQGEDIVSGLVTTYPISVEQAELDGRSEEMSLETRFPAIYQRLLAIARDLVYEKRWNPQEIEFTFEGPEAERSLSPADPRHDHHQEEGELRRLCRRLETEQSLLGKGIGVSGSALAGQGGLHRGEYPRAAGSRTRTRR